MMTMDKRPNILVILSDQLRRQALGCYGNCDVATPHMDALAKSGVRFSNACSTYPVCVPFRFSLMTGEYAHTRFVPRSDWRMSPAERTLADEFNDAGYETFYVGKWHLHGGHGVLPSHSFLKANRMPVPRSHQGRFKHWRGFELRNDPYDTCYFKDDDPTPRPLGKYQTDGLFDLTMELLSKPQSAPFFGIVSVEPPHTPHVAPPELEARWKEREVHLPPNFSAKNDAQRAAFLHTYRIYHAMVENLDANIGRCRKFLEENGLSENTIVVLMADHGDLLGSHGRQKKWWPYEESIGIPLVVFDPRCTERAGRVIEEPTCTEDLFLTLLGLAGLPPRSDLPGDDLAPLVRGEITELVRAGVYLEFVADFKPDNPFHARTWRGFRGRRYKYTMLDGAPWQFFDLQNDPYEMHCLLNDDRHAAPLRAHHILLRERLIDSGDDYILSPAFGCEGANLWQ
jgi:arylsulfatase A-like enzyme